LWISHNRGGQWTRLKANLPTTPIYEMKIHSRDNDLILATHARGLWILDDVGIIQQWAKAEAADAFAFEPEPATAFNAANDRMKGFEGDRLFLGLNPAPGATLAYRLKADAKEVSWVIRDGNEQVREIAGDAMQDRNKAGLQIVKWDLRVQPLRPLSTPPGGTPAPVGGGGFNTGGNNGPFVLPGTYRATLRVDGKDVQTVNVAVRGDAEITITDADRRTWFEAAKGLHDLHAQANQAAEVVQHAWAQLTLLQQQTRDATVPAGPKKSMDTLSADLERLRRRLGLAGGGFGANAENVRGRITQTKGAVMGATGVPTATQTAQIRELRAALPRVVDEANAAGRRVPELVRDLLSAGVIFTPVK
jgi:antitoxin component of MazEF toxin-antitoxin module